MLRCHGICDSLLTFNRYTDYTRFCSVCGKHLVFLHELPPRFCPCCSSILRTKKRLKRHWIDNKHYPDKLVRI